MGVLEKERKVSIGRDAGSGFALDHETVSRRHAELIATENGLLFVTDCHSSNGTFLLRGNAKSRVRQDFVEESDTLMFGDVRVRVADLVSKATFAERGRIGKGVAGKSATIAAPAKSAQSAEPASQGKPANRPQPEFSESVRLVRCSCGAVKAADRRCEECGK